jgi:molecular chaperone GrpE
MSKEKVSNKINEEIKKDIQKENETNEDIETESISTVNDDNNIERIKTLEAEINQYKELALRKAAEFENYKRRTENDQLNLLKYAAESFIIKLLPTVDDFERSILHMNDDIDVSKIKEGIQLVYNKLLKTLDEQGVKKIESVGKPFSVEYHEALMQRPDASVPSHTVLDELETGYMYKDRVIRHSKVIVSEESSS